MLRSSSLAFLLIVCLTFDSGEANSSSETIKENEWKTIAKTEPTCKGTEIDRKIGISLEKCKDFGNSKKNAKFIWYGHQDRESPLSVDNGLAICILYKECDLDKKARMPARPGRTYKKKVSDYEWKKIAKTEPTCKDTEIDKKIDISLKECFDFGNSRKNAKFIWYGLATDKVPAVCVLYKECDLDKKARMPSRQGRTYELKSSGDA